MNENINEVVEAGVEYYTKSEVQEIVTKAVYDAMTKIKSKEAKCGLIGAGIAAGGLAIYGGVLKLKGKIKAKKNKVDGTVVKEEIVKE